MIHCEATWWTEWGLMFARGPFSASRDRSASHAWGRSESRSVELSWSRSFHGGSSRRAQRRSLVSYGSAGPVALTLPLGGGTA